MDPPSGPGARSKPDSSVLDPVTFGEDILQLISVLPENASSFTALLELPPNRAVDLLHSPNSNPHQPSYPNLTFPTNSALIERAARFSVFACSLTGASPKKAVKCEPADTDSSQPLVSDSTEEKHNLREDKRMKVDNSSSSTTNNKRSAKKSKTEINESAEKLPYVHVRARRGQATDSHSLAERARREKINARMKLLQELVPGCTKISGTALVLDEIIYHVQSLQRQVEHLSMRLAAVNSSIDFNHDCMLAADCGSQVDSNFPGVGLPLNLPEIQVSGNRPQYQQQWHFDELPQLAWGREDNHNFVTTENSLVTYDSSGNSASRHSNQLKMEL